VLQRPIESTSLCGHIGITSGLLVNENYQSAATSYSSGP
jgi:hypothetical protein